MLIPIGVSFGKKYYNFQNPFVIDAKYMYDKLNWFKEKKDKMCFIDRTLIQK